MLLVLASSGIHAWAQIAVPPPAPPVQLRSNAELDQLLGPIALYPDPLIAQVLPSATLPTEVVLADRYVNGGGDPNLIDQQPWDPSIKALARYPSVLKMMDDNLAWTTDVGQAFLYQQQDVMNSVQRLRAQAQALGNLQTTPQEVVVTDGGAINILPAQPQLIYVPVYQPEMVYFQRPFGDPFISFGFGFAIGGWLNYDFDWHNHHLVEWGYDHPRPVDWWSRRPSERPREEFVHTTVWAPRNRPNSVTANRVDRGWNTPAIHPAIAARSDPRPAERARTPGPVSRPPAEVVRQQPASPATVTRPQLQAAQPRESPARIVQPVAPAVRRPEPAVITHPAAVSAPRPASGALIGVQSSRATQQFSNRGQQSRQTVTSPVLAPTRQAPATPPHSSPPERATSSPGKR